MQIICPKCNAVIGEVSAVARLILTAHCPFDGNDFGVAVEPPEQGTLPVTEPEPPAPPAP